MTENLKKLTLGELLEIRKSAKLATNIDDWKTTLKAHAVKYNLTDKEVIDIANGRLPKELVERC